MKQSKENENQRGFAFNRSGILPRAGHCFNRDIDLGEPMNLTATIEPARTKGCSRVVLKFDHGGKEITVRGRVFPNNFSPHEVGAALDEVVTEFRMAVVKEFRE